MMDIKGIYHADANRYSDAEALYKRCGKSGILLPKISLGFWHRDFSPTAISTESHQTAVWQKSIF